MQTQSTHVTPYEYFAKPIQPIDFFQSNFETLTSQQNLNQQAGGAPNSMPDNTEQIDFDKLLASIGQLASTYHQVSPIVKQLGSLIKLMR
ncbi:YppG family protein [Oceanobacillus sp. CAU 1775]